MFVHVALDIGSVAATVFRWFQVLRRDVMTRHHCQFEAIINWWTGIHIEKERYLSRQHSLVRDALRCNKLHIINSSYFGQLWKMDKPPGKGF